METNPYELISRHGKRLDAADKQWHLSSPTPYDPPLTYGGWTQSKIVGARIASILQENGIDDEPTTASQTPYTFPHKQKKRRYNIVIHSSPFLRCVQTSVAIAAGLASNPPPAAPIDRSPSPRSSQISPSSSATSIQPLASTNTNTGLSQDPANQNVLDRSVLRLDPFLGEWLSPDYFEHITPPPKSSLMLATAKAELLRRENYNDYPHFYARHAPSTNTNTSSQLWSASPTRGSPLITSMTPDSDALEGLDGLSALKGGLPRVRSESVGTLDPKAAQKLSHPLDPSCNSGYIAPIPAYALSTSEPIPKGYVAHARDACVDIDYQWDSSRDNLGWGDGGVLPEEWAAMHQRFRKGLNRLVEWYSTTENPGEMVTKTVSNRNPIKPPAGEESDISSLPAESDQEVETENVVVLVSHGAGCNALIGALTQQPVLIDVGMSSITMAQRKPHFDHDLDPSIYRKVPTSLEEPLLTKQPTMAEIFELKLFANTEHLHSAATPPAVSRSASAGGRNPRGRYGNGFPSALKDINFGASLYGGSPSGSRSNSLNASLGSMRRGSPVLASSIWPPPNHVGSGGITVGSGVTSFSSTRPSRPGSSGLWAPPNQEDDLTEKVTPTPFPLLPSHDEENETKETNGKDIPKVQEQESSSNDMVSAPSPKKGILTPRPQTSQGEERDKFDGDAVPQLWAGVGNGGLWSVPRPPGEAERIRDFTSSKRRWTVNER